ncbi:MAG: hypothetical protein CMN78_02520 [Spirochaetales bacterium]|nr:hypothetical protein [Spirochaetales bacterium]
MKLGVSHQRQEQLKPEHFKYLRQMGVEAMEIRIPTADATPQNLSRIKKTVEAEGLEVFEVMLMDSYSMEAVALDLPGSAEALARFKTFLRDLSDAGITRTTYAWSMGGTYQTGRSTTRESTTRLFKLEEALAVPDTYDRTYDDESMWKSYTRFIEEVLPVAEDAGVSLQLHPSDPPVTHAGVASIFRSTEAFRRGMEMANHSEYSGILFCVGTWGEMPGPNGTGEDVVAAIREFGGQGHIKQVHFRNTSGHLPDFIETYPDNGYLDMLAIMQALRDVEFEGIVVPDHVPRIGEEASEAKIGEAYIFGYIRSLMESTKSL